MKFFDIQSLFVPIVITEERHCFYWYQYHPYLICCLLPSGYENPTHQNYHYFIGCMRNLRYQRPDDLFSEVPIHTMKAVLPGCSNKCQEDNLCENGAECVNKYSEVTCNCYGTEFEGEHCENSGEWFDCFFDLCTLEWIDESGACIQFRRVA